jgi:hypothetical protein
VSRENDHGFRLQSQVVRASKPELDMFSMGRKWIADDFYYVDLEPIEENRIEETFQGSRRQ